MSTITFSQKLADFLPGKVNQYQPKEDDNFYDSESLYDYINGSAELYISYGFDKVISRTYEYENHPEITVEIFDMINAKDAFGVFSNQRHKNDMEFGQGSQYIEGSLIFWKARYFVSVVTHTETTVTRNTIFDIAERIDSAISSTGKKPSIITLIPEENRLAHSTCYFHHYIWQNSYFFISTDNIFSINEKTDAVLAKYGDSESRFFLLIIKYNENKKAEIAFQAFYNLFEEDGNKKWIKAEKNTYFGAENHENIFCAVLNAPDKKSAKKLLQKIKNTIQNQ